MLKRMRSSRLSKILQSGACFNLILNSFSQDLFKCISSLPSTSPSHTLLLYGLHSIQLVSRRENKTDLKVVGLRRFKHFQSPKSLLYYLSFVPHIFLYFLFLLFPHSVPSVLTLFFVYLFTSSLILNIRQVSLPIKQITYYF